MMTKKDFKELANGCAKFFETGTTEQNNEILDFICRFCYNNNSRFDRLRFEEWIRRVRAGEDLKGLR